MAGVCESIVSWSSLINWLEVSCKCGRLVRARSTSLCNMQDDICAYLRENAHWISERAHVLLMVLQSEHCAVQLPRELVCCILYHCQYEDADVPDAPAQGGPEEFQELFCSVGSDYSFRVSWAPYKCEYVGLRAGP